MKSILFALCLLIGNAVYGQQFSQRYELVKLGPEVNTFYHEAAPVISPDGKDLYIFVQNHPDNTFGKENTQDIWVTHKDEKGWTQVKRLGSPLNQNHTNQVFGVLPDGSLLIRGGRGKDEVGFSIVPKDRGRTTELQVKDFKEIRRGKFYGATMSSDMKHMVLYFSEAPASPKSDLYICHVQPDGTWTRPVKLKITDGSDEYGPFLSPDDKYLFFASDRSDPNKQGGSDIYRSERLDDTWNNWSKPVNLKRPVNTAAGDGYFTIDKQGTVYTSRANSKIDGGNLDIFTLMPKDIKVMLAGIVYNDKTKAIISSSDVKVEMQGVPPVNLKTTGGKFETSIPEIEKYTLTASAPGFLPSNETFSVPHIMNDTTLRTDIYLTPVVVIVAKPLILMGTVFDKKTEKPVTASIDLVFKPERRNTMKLDAAGGKYEREVAKTGWYLLTASAEGYMNATDSVELVSAENTPVTKDLFLQPIEVGLTIQLKNIYFEFDKTTLKPESFIELNKVVEFLKSNPRVEIEIAGHTDNKGSDEYNANLSQGRSQAVVDYVASQGVDIARLSAHGYGESKPIDTNDTKDGQANNRRVEFTVLKN